jgi:hypothetical protein
MMTILNKTNNDKPEIIAGRSKHRRSSDDSVTSTTTTTTTSITTIDEGRASSPPPFLPPPPSSSSSSLTHMMDAAIMANDLTALRQLLLQQSQPTGRVLATGEYIAAAIGTAVAEGNVDACRLLFRFVRFYGKEKQYGFVNENHLGEDCLVHLASMMRHLYV